MRGLPASRDPRRASVLVVALLLAAMIALCLGSYLSLNLQTTRLAKRTFYGYAALNLTEAGAEAAVWSFNRAAAQQADAWDGWSRSGAAATRRFSDFAFSQNTQGTVQVYVENHEPAANATSRLIALATVTPANESGIVRMLEVTVRRRSLFANGLLAREAVVFNGTNTSVDSWNSDPDANPATAGVPYSAAIRNDNGIVASTSVTSSSVLLNQASVWGYVFTGGGQPSVGNNGTIRGETTPDGVQIDPGRVATDFNANLQVITAPVDGTTVTTLGATLGTAGASTKWRVSSINLSGTNTLTILGDVTLVVTASAAGKAIDVSGNASIMVPEGSTLNLYAEGEIKIAGKGLLNSNSHPGSTMIWGTRASGTQSLHIAGNGALKAVIYAPNADISINGNGDIMGSVVGQNITLTGNASFHFDESLGNYGTSSYGLSEWRELHTLEERQPYLGLFSGW